MRRASCANLLIAALLLSAGGAQLPAVDAATSRLQLPWREAGLTERQAAAHLLDRLTYGPRPGEVDRVVAEGLERWTERQLAAVGAPAPPAPGSALARGLARLPALAMSAREIAEVYPPGPLLRRRAEEAGVIERRSAGDGAAAAMPKPGGRREVAAWMEREGLKSERELVAQSYAWKLLSAAGSENQLHELLADFWFNHFNVSISDNAVRSHLLAYERDAIRPHLAGRFRDLLGATAKHPAMLAYLDNFQSTANPGQPTLAGPVERFGRRGAEAARPKRPEGLNENYARELLELHSLGVDGGYTQQDVVEVARAFTGWAFIPPGRMDDGRYEAIAARAGRLGPSGRRGPGGPRDPRGERGRREGDLFARSGFVLDGEFLFRPDAHDAAAKTVLGRRLAAGRGLADGEEVLDLIAAHPATARHLAQKLAARFVADEPPPELVERLAARFSESGGDLTAVMRALVAAPEFWASAHRGQKIKSPFEVAVSALRALDAEIDNPFPTAEWVARMGQQLYAYQAPTGFPDRADFWVNTGALLSRMNFGIELAAGRLPGVRFDLEALTDGREPESTGAALASCAAALLPERDVAPTVAELLPLLARPELPSKLALRAPAAAQPAADDDPFGDLADPAGAEMSASPPVPPAGASRRPPPRAGEDRRQSFDRIDLFPRAVAMNAPAQPPTAVAGVVGLLLGSPEFQRR